MIMLAKKYSPKKLDDLKGNPQAHKQLNEIVKQGGRVLLVGTPGIGKTSAVYAIAKELNLKVIEINASDERKKEDIKDIARRCQMFNFGGRGMVYLIDEVDGTHFESWKTVVDILMLSRYPVVLTANEDRSIPGSVKELCVVIKLRAPYLNTVVDVVREIANKERIGDKVDFSGINRRDMRNAINVVLYGGESYESRSPFTVVSDFFTKGRLDGVTLRESAWLFDNAPKFLFGIDLFEFYEALEVASRSDISALNVVAKGRGNRVNFPTYFRIRSAKKRQNERTKK